MTFTSLASSSKGNAYLVEADGVAPLLLEAGISIKYLREKLYHLGVKLSDLAGCLISHEHGDHSKAVKDLLKAGVDCYMSRGTGEALGIEGHHRMFSVKDKTTIIADEWYVRPFPLEHDAKEPLGFIIVNDREKLLFIPDTAFVKPRFEAPTIIVIECNHIADILTENILNGSLPACAGHRIRRNHMNLENMITLLKSNDLSKCREIHLIHLSDGNSDEARMIRTVQEQTGIPCYAAE